MKVYLGDQAKRLAESDKIPLNSIGVWECYGSGWGYWFSSSYFLDIGIKPTEQLALKTAKLNFNHI